MNKKIGIGILTCNRPAYLKSLLNSLKELKSSDVYQMVIINDGQHINEFDTTQYTVLNNGSNLGVGKSKNKALKYLLDAGNEYFFLIEDDVVVKNIEVFERYINTSKVSGIQHFNFAFHGKDNYDQLGNPNILLKIEYSGGYNVCLYPNVYGAFSFYTKRCIQEVGYMDEFYYNAMEHVDHTNEIILKNMHPPFRWFADIENSQNYLNEIDRNHSGSEIRKGQEWISNFHKCADYFAKKFNFDVRDPRAFVANKEQVIMCLKEIKKNNKINE